MTLVSNFMIIINHDIFPSDHRILMIMLICILEHGPLKVCDSCLLPLQQSFKLEVRLPSVQKYNLIITAIILTINVFVTIKSCININYKSA